MWRSAWGGKQGGVIAGLATCTVMQCVVGTIRPDRMSRSNAIRASLLDNIWPERCLMSSDRQLHLWHSQDSYVKDHLSCGNTRDSFCQNDRCSLPKSCQINHGYNYGSNMQFSRMRTIEHCSWLTYSSLAGMCTDLMQDFRTGHMVRSLISDLYCCIWYPHGTLLFCWRHCRWIT